jgi:hypothetical protein
VPYLPDPLLVPVHQLVTNRIEPSGGSYEISSIRISVLAQRSETIKQLALSHGERVLDIGCGPGFLCESEAAGRLLVATDWDAVVWDSETPDSKALVLKAWETHCAIPTYLVYKI